MVEKYFRGEIYYIYPREAVGSEQTGGRPGIIVSNDMGNEYSRTVEVVFLTTRDKKPLPTHVFINSARQRSIALCESIHTVDKERIGDFINSVTEAELNEVERAILVGLDIHSNIKGSKKLEAWSKLIESWESDNEEEPTEVKPEVIPKPVNITLNEMEIVEIETNPKYIKACAERDVYKELYLELRNSKTA